MTTVVDVVVDAVVDVVVDAVVEVVVELVVDSGFWMRVLVELFDDAVAAVAGSSCTPTRRAARATPALTSF